MDSDIRFSYPIELIRTGIIYLYNTRQIKMSKCGGYYLYEPYRAFTLYCLQKTPTGYMPLNREYKPLGISFYKPWSKYEEFPFLLIPENNVRIEGLKEVNGNFYIYDDCTFPDCRKNKDLYVENVMHAIPELQQIKKTIKQGKEYCE